MSTELLAHIKQVAMVFFFAINSIHLKVIFLLSWKKLAIFVISEALLEIHSDIPTNFATHI